MAAQPVAIVASDWHLEVGAFGRHPNLTGDAFVSLRQVVTAAFALSPYGARPLEILAPGDLHDTPEQIPEVILETVEVLTRAPDPVWVRYVRGQHDGYGRCWLSLIPQAIDCDRQRFDIGPYKGYGLSYRKTKEEVLAEFAAVPPDVDLLMTHQVWRDLVGFGSAGVKTTDIPRGMMVISGDYHVSRTKPYQAVDGSTGTLLSPGPLAMQKIDEPPEKYYWILNDDRTAVPVQLQTRPFASVEIRTEEDLVKFETETIAGLADRSAALAGMAAAGYPTYARIVRPHAQVKIAPGLVSAAARVETALERIQAFHDISSLPAEAAPQATEPLRGGTPAVYAAALQTCGIPQDSQVYADAERLITATDPAAELAAIRKAHYHPEPSCASVPSI